MAFRARRRARMRGHSVSSSAVSQTPFRVVRIRFVSGEGGVCGGMAPRLISASSQPTRPLSSWLPSLREVRVDVDTKSKTELRREWLCARNEWDRQPGNAPVTCWLWRSIANLNYPPRPSYSQGCAPACALHISSRLNTRLSCAHLRRIGKPAAKMMTPVRYILLALFLVVRIAP
jgi:hypothetical protein